ncbi:MAG TPA: tetratricopeptide repeat protein [Gemmataceae bacterium]|jgi:tetratricopeptide (TPR) repeat protein|nr:tetratricopeptide repeat protein [Gemmataceae bacterium]
MLGFPLIAIATTIAAPALPARTDWVGEVVYIKKETATYGRVEADGTFTPIARVKSIQYVVQRDEKGYLEFKQDGKPIWVKKDDMVRQKDAVEHFTKMLDEDPNNDIWFAFRGWVRHRTGKTAEGLKDYAEAIRLKPMAAAWYSNRALIYLEAKNVDDAIADLTSAIELSPNNEVYYRNRAMAYSRKKDWANAAEDFGKVIELVPDSATSMNGLAWLLCTAPDQKVRDGKRALEYAKKACELTENKNGGYLDTLAAAYAEVGDFAKAVEWQEKALKTGDLPIKDMEAARQRLALYKDKKPYRGE